MVNKDTHIAQRMQHINPFYVMDILAQAKQLEAEGFDVIHLEVGEPDFVTPDAVKQAARQAIDNNKTFYTPATGLSELKTKISTYYLNRLGALVKPENIVITPGASGALQLALSVVVNPGQNVLMADPGYPCNRHFVSLLEGKAKTLNVGPQTDYQLTHQLIDQNWDKDTVAVLIASPSNPTGTLINRDEMLKIFDVVKRREGVLLVDEIYQGLVYELEEYSAASLLPLENDPVGMGQDGIEREGIGRQGQPSVFVINSFSKFFSMTGWRLGWLIVPETYLDAVDRLAQNLFLAPPTVSQYAALAAFEPGNLQLLDGQRDELRRRRDYLLKGLLELGFEISVKPAGAFYIYANVAKFTTDSFSFCELLLEKAHVAITPGLDFGDNKPELHVRFAYTQSIARLQQALERIRDFLSTL